MVAHINKLNELPQTDIEKLVNILDSLSDESLTIVLRSVGFTLKASN